MAVKKMWLIQKKDTIEFSKKDGIWKQNGQFDGMGKATQIINYLSTMRLEKHSLPNSDFTPLIQLYTFDKAGKSTNKILVGTEIGQGKCLALLNSNQLIIIYNSQNKHALLELLKKSFESKR